MRERTKGDASSVSPVRLGSEAILRELGEVNRKLARGAERLAELTEEELAIATAPKDEVYRSDMVRLYRYRPVVERPASVPVLIVYALVGRYQMIDLEADRSFVRKLLGEGLDVYMVDWGLPTRAHRWLDIGDYVNGYLDDCVEVIRARHGLGAIDLLGICQGGVFSTCYAALHRQRLRNLVLAVTPLDFHGDSGRLEAGAGYMNLWARTLSGEDIDALVDAFGAIPGAMVGFSFLMMSPVGNLAKYTTELVDLLGDDRRLLNFLRMERWIADRPDHPGELVRQWFKDLYQANKLVRSELELDGRRVDLKNITLPVLNVFAEGDVVVPTACSRGVGDRFGTHDYTELAVPGGHIGTFVGGKAQKILAPAIARWIRERS